ncbi:MAG: prephenate dehydratase domain-containing protein [Candidatus Melainabacteria bacterium]|nr:prephenate dehydratase domain-containing protein [Candidatus Melainabacteria bacterium]
MSSTPILPQQLGYLGPEGSHSYQSAVRLQAFWQAHSLAGGVEALTLTPFRSMTELMRAAQEDTGLLALLPYENALEGSLIEVLEGLGLQKYALFPIAEVLSAVAHALIAPEDVPIHTVISHPMALAQCREQLLARYGSNLRYETVTSTSEAVRKVRELLDNGQTGWAALGTAAAAALHQLPLRELDLSDAPNNVTRFFLVSSQAHPLDWAASLLEHFPEKTSLCVSLPEYPGVLVDFLLIIKSYGVNLTKLESRPSRKRYGEYFFYMDAEGDLAPVDNGRLLKTLRQKATYTHVLGPYACLGHLQD